jgi:hypothetical protein
MQSKRKRKYDYQQKQTQREANVLLEQIILNLKKVLPNIYWAKRDEEDQEDYGIDLQYELRDSIENETKLIFKVQNKGWGKKLEPKKNGLNKGLIPFQLPLKKAKYFLYQLNIPIVFVVCDIPSQIVYWHAIQLDTLMEEAIEAADRKEAGSIQIYIHPEKQLCGATVEEFLTDLRDSQREQAIRYNSLQEGTFTRPEIKINKNQHLLDQTHEAFVKYFDEFTVIPPFELLQLYPFKKTPAAIVHYHCFEATIENEEFFTLLENIADIDLIADPIILAVKNYKEKAKAILRVLRLHGIDYVILWKTQKTVSLIKDWHHIRDNSCRCCRCLFNRFELMEAMRTANMSTGNESIEDMLKRGYIQYQTGNYITSYRIFHEAKLRARRNRKWVFYFICVFNIHQLKTFITNYSWDHPDRSAILREISKVNIDKEFAAMEGRRLFGYNIVKLLYENKIFTKHYHEISEAVLKIEKHYYSQLKGGWSSNRYICEVLSEMWHATVFLNFNFVIYDKYVNYSDLFGLIIKGALCSHAIRESEKSRLSRFSDMVIRNFLFYGKAEELVVYFNRYDLKEVAFESMCSPSELIVLITNFFRMYADLDSYKDVIEPGNMNGQGRWIDIANNAFVLCAMLNITPHEAQIVSELLVETIAKMPNDSLLGLRFLHTFISRKGNHFKAKTVGQLLDLSITHPKLHDSVFIESICDCTRKYFPDVKLKIAQVEALIKIYYDKCLSCNYAHQRDILVDYYFVSNLEGQILIRESIEKLLNLNFDPALYYNATIYNVINPVQFLDNFIEYSKPKPDRVSFNAIFFGKEDKISVSINMLVHILYKFEYSLTDKKFQLYRRQDPYYEWLFNLENFDYDKFDPMWIFIAPIHDILIRIARVKAVREAVRNYLNKTHNYELQKIYIDYFVPEDIKQQ